MSASLATSNRTKAADLLLHARLLSKEQHVQVLQRLELSADRAEEVLIEAEIFSEADLLKALSGVYRTHYLSTEKLAKADIPRSTVQMIPKRVAETLGVFPVLFDPNKGVLSVVTADPDNLEVLREVKLVSGAKDVKAFVARPAAVSAAIRKFHGGDPRAFAGLEAANYGYDFGQQVLADGRVMAAKDTFRANAAALETPKPIPTPFESREAAARAVDPMAQTGKQAAGRRPSVPDDGIDFGAPRRRPPSMREPDGERPTSISAPPPPPVPAAKAAAQPAQAQAPARPPPVPQRDAVVGPKPARTPEQFEEQSALESLPPAAVKPQVAGSGRDHPLLNDTTIELLTVMVSLLESSRQELRGHSSQVARLLRRIAERMRLDKQDGLGLVVAGLVHDVGKMGQFHLTALNCSEYEGHRTAAQKAVDTPLRLLEAVRLPPSVKNAVFHMYERIDGKGFPDKLVGKEIPLGARVLAVADTYSDLTQNPRNPFRKVLGPAEAMNVLMTHKGTIFDPGILDLIKSIVLDEDLKAKLLANRHRALIVDADPEESTVLELRMVEQGFDVRTARTIDAARKQLTEGEFDLVVCEVELPDADGLAFLSEARKEKWGRDLAWVVLTRKQGRTEAQRAFELGAMDFVAKPTQAEVLVAKLKAMLDQQNARGGSKQAKGVNGSLREMGLPDIVQVLFHGRKTGKLVVRSNGSSGEIHFLEGNVANALLGDLSGANAFYAMLRFQDGDFALDPSFTPPERKIQEPAEALLLEGMRRMDEGI